MCQENTITSPTPGQDCGRKAGWVHEIPATDAQSGRKPSAASAEIQVIHWTRLHIPSPGELVPTQA